MPQSPTLSRRAAHARALTDHVLADEDAAAALDTVVQHALRRLGADAAQVSMMTDGVVSLCPGGALAGAVASGARRPFEESFCAQVLRSDDPVVIPDARADQRVAGIGAVTDGRVGAYLGVPVRVGGDVVGVLCLFAGAPRAWTAPEVDELTTLATRVADVLRQHAVSA